jgi:hypothetical protein
MAPPIHLKFHARDMPKSGGGSWQGARAKAAPRLYTLEEVKAMGCDLVEWNGR